MGSRSKSERGKFARVSAGIAPLVDSQTLCHPRNRRQQPGHRLKAVTPHPNGNVSKKMSMIPIQVRVDPTYKFDLLLNPELPRDTPNMLGILRPV